MPIDTPHPAYTVRLPQWVRCRDCKAGTDAVKARGPAYLPQLTGQDWTEYLAYTTRAYFYPATERTVEGLTGLVLRKPAEIVVPDNVEADMADLTLTGQSWEALLLELLDELCTVGRLGILIDYPKENGLRPYWTLYRAEQILNWNTGTVLDPDGIERTGVTRVILMETKPVPSSTDPYTVNQQPQLRVLDCSSGIYVVSLWRRRQDLAELTGTGVLGQQWEQIEETTPLRRGKPLTAIPFVFIGARHGRPEPDKPPLLDMVDTNLSHYRNSADLEHGRHWTALPTPYVTGLQTQSQLRIGSSTAWAIPEVNSKVGMLEFTGQGLAALEKALEHKEKLMANLGARMLDQQSSGHSETATAIRLRQSGEAATLTSMVCTIDEGLEDAFCWHAWWLGSDEAFTTDGVCDVELNQDFFEPPMDPQAASTLLTMWQSGGISWETYFYLLQRGEWMRPSAEADEEKALIIAEGGTAAPIVPAAPVPPGGGMDTGRASEP
jgi:hypothetical protein